MNVTRMVLVLANNLMEFSDMGEKTDEKED